MLTYENLKKNLGKVKLENLSTESEKFKVYTYGSSWWLDHVALWLRSKLPEIHTLTWTVISAGVVTGFSGSSMLSSDKITP